MIPATKHEQYLPQRVAVHLHWTNSTMASRAGFSVDMTGVSIPSAKLQPYLAGSGNSMMGTMSLHQIRQQELVVVSRLLLACLKMFHRTFEMRVSLLYGL